MKKQFLLLIGAFFTATTLFAQQIPNGGFETWTNPYNPDSWVTQASYLESIGQAGIAGVAATLATQEATTVIQGSSSIKLTTADFSTFQFGIVPGWVEYTDAPFTGTPDTLRFAFNYAPSSPADTGKVAVWFHVSQGWLPVRFSLTSTNGQWAGYYAPLTSAWAQYGSPDSIFISATSGVDTTTAGSVLYLDAFQLVYNSPQATDPTVTLSVSPATISEGQSAVFTVSLDAAAASDITVNLAGLPTGTAAFGTDYTVVGLTVPSVTIPAGQTSVSVTVNALTDTETEGAETVVVSLAAGTGYVLGTSSSATLTINDVPVGAPAVSLSVSPESVVEGGSATFTATLSSAATAAINVPYTLSGNATEGNDYTGTGTSFSFAPGATTATLSVLTVDDTETEGNETLTITLSAGTGYVVGTASATLTITDNDGTGIKETETMKAISLYPNPATTAVNVVVPAEVSTQNITITDVTGKAVKLENNVSGAKVIALDGLNNGSYIVTFTDASTNAFTGSKQLQITK